jgi:hypothetical protein
MLSFDEFFVACAGIWKTERTYHFVNESRIERSYTEFQVTSLSQAEKQQILILSQSSRSQFPQVEVDATQLQQEAVTVPGFAIAFNTRSETGETVSMSLKALFVPDTYIASASIPVTLPVLPVAAEVANKPDGEVIQGFYLRDEGYSEAGAIAGRFTYQPTRQTLEMTTFYNRSVAVDQMRLVAPDLRLRTIVTYQRPQPGEVPTVIDLIGFGVEHRQSVPAV